MPADSRVNTPGTAAAAPWSQSHGSTAAKSGDAKRHSGESKKPLRAESGEVTRGSSPLTGTHFGGAAGGTDAGAPLVQRVDALAASVAQVSLHLAALMCPCRVTDASLPTRRWRRTCLHASGNRCVPVLKLMRLYLARRPCCSSWRQRPSGRHVISACWSWCRSCGVCVSSVSVCRRTDVSLTLLELEQELVSKSPRTSLSARR